MKTLFLRIATTAFLMIAAECSAMSRGQCIKPNYDKAASILTNKAIDSIEKRYKIRCIGTGASMPGGPIRFVTVSFQMYGAVSKQQLRRVLVTSAQDMLNVANEIPDLDACLYAPPFGIKNLDILMFVYDANGRDTYDPDISSARLSDGVLEFKTDAPNCYLKVLNQYTETYEEALKAIEEEDSSN